jgi:hypothetical protein
MHAVMTSSSSSYVDYVRSGMGSATLQKRSSLFSRTWSRFRILSRTTTAHIGWPSTVFDWRKIYPSQEPIGMEQL